MEWNFKDGIPIYTQIIDEMTMRIASSAYAPGDKLPSVRDLALDAGVNPNTMQRALNELEREGLLVSERTAGRFVTEDKTLISRLRSEMAVDTVDAFRKEMAALGFSDEEMIEFFRKRCEVTGGTFTLERIG